MKTAFLAGVSVAATLVASAAVVGCSGASDPCTGIAGCSAPEDSLGYERGAGEISGDPGIVLVHTPRGAYPNDPVTKKLAVLSPSGLTLRDDVPPDFASKKVSITDVETGHTRYAFPESGDVVDVTVETSRVRIVVTGRTSATYACSAGLNGAIRCEK